jgi:hypothetical protein
MYTVEMASGGMIILPSFMKIDVGVQTILRLASAVGMAVMLVLLRENNYEGHRCDQLSWHDVRVHREFQENWCRRSSNT